MSNLKELKNRITSVKSTQKITSAMKMVAASRLKRAQEAAEAAGHLREDRPGPARHPLRQAVGGGGAREPLGRVAQVSPAIRRAPESCRTSVDAVF